MQSVRSLLRACVSPGAFCLVFGLAGGLLLGYVLSRGGGWMTPAPWAIYLVALLAAIAAVSWLDERRRSPAVSVAAESGGATAAPGVADADPPANLLEFRREPGSETSPQAEADIAAPRETNGEEVAPHEVAETVRTEVAGEC